MFKNQLTGITMACAATIVALGMFGQATAMGQDAAQQATFRATALMGQNAARANYSQGGVQPLTESASLGAAAQAWAVHLASINRLEHSPTESRPEDAGENVFVVRDTNTVGPAEVAALMVGDWYGERTSYDYSQPGLPGTGHFTQMIWKSSTTVGCGYAIGSGTSPKGRTWNTYFGVCLYSPPGNFRGQYEANVPGPNPGVLGDIFQWPLPINDVRGQHAANVPMPKTYYQAEP